MHKNFVCSPAGSWLDFPNVTNLSGSNLQFMEGRDSSTKCPSNPYEKVGANLGRTLKCGGHIDDEIPKGDLSSCPYGACSKLQFMKNIDSSTKCPSSPYERGGRNYITGNTNTCFKSPDGAGRSDFQQKIPEDIQETKQIPKGLVDTRLEAKRCMEKMTETLNRNERKYQQLQQHLMMATGASYDTGTVSESQTKDLKRQLECQCNDELELKARNKILREQVRLLQCRCYELQKDLFKERHSKARTMRTLEEQTRFRVCDVSNAGDFKTSSIVEGECDQSNRVAGKLSRTLMFSCDSCHNKVPRAVKDLENELVNLLDLVESRRA